MNVLSKSYIIDVEQKSKENHLENEIQDTQEARVKKSKDDKYDKLRLRHGECIPNPFTALNPACASIPCIPCTII